ncbi:hypothetical protein [Bdellovibrio reynosensis]|uniref:Uncharacterized protein n=1 Tax=Bdellovibrio reynosensis TaxID=2835041 RepID=A0ABY4CCC7_9BACT|nr:hypothetical protein [Bdellovibrio reynosensis]UOF02631.1 hypothetical protein MNR06_06670 [Bdellovibrio reynosensis]
MLVKYRVFLSALFLILIPGLSFAEYRVFVLKITKKAATAPTEGRAPASAAPDFRLVESTLDPTQYRFYHQLAPDEDVTYIDTWRCYGRTGDFQALCPNPKGQIQEAANPSP